MKKRKQISLKRLFMLAVGFCKDKTMKDVEMIAEYLKYVSVHKEDEL